MRYTHHKQKGLRELQRACKTLKDSYIVVDKGTNKIVYIAPVGADISDYIRRDQLYMYYQTGR